MNHSATLNQATERTITLTAQGRKRERLDKMLATALAEQGISRERVKQLVKEGRVTVAGETCHAPTTLITPGTALAVTLPVVAAALTPEVGDVPIVYQDEHVAVINKPAQLTVHPCPSQPSGTLAHMLLHHFPALRLMQGERPGIVHRLDKDTTGLLLVALNERARLVLVEQFAARTVYKEYLALVHGVPKHPTGTIDANIGRHPTHKTRMTVVAQGKAAKTAYTTLYADPQKRFALLAVQIFTGRTHQIRVHLQHIGHPLLGDATYGPLAGKTRPSMNHTAYARPMLHAWRLAFTHPCPAPPEHAADSKSRVATPQQSLPSQPHTGKALAFACPPPQDFTQAFAALTNTFQPVVITGSPGCGKSRLLERLACMGYPTISADAVVAHLYTAGGDGTRLLQARFGERFMREDGQGVDKTLLGPAMMADNSLRREVEALIHPLVFHAIETFWQRAEQAGATYAFAEIPLYLEAGAPFTAAMLVGVNAPVAVREQRLMHTRGWPLATVQAIEAWQWTQQQKMNACTHVLDNTENDPQGVLLQERVDRLLQQIAAHEQGAATALFKRLERLWATPPHEVSGV